tara:strand:- start:4151 stop:4486 length:336 start_codon:yes stop_codon:yes gene_type:complete
MINTEHNKILLDPSNDKELLSSFSDKPVSLVEYLFEFYLYNILDEVFDESLHKYQPETQKKKFIHKIIPFNLEYACQYIDPRDLDKIINKYYDLLIKEKLYSIGITKADRK